MADKKVAKKIEQEIKKIENKKNKILFFVYDTKGAPNGSLAYIYETANTLKELGYNVQMLHSDKEFIGVESWLGEKYSSLPHFNIEKDSVDVSPSDILVIPELCTSVMSQTKNLPCKRIMLLQNYSYLTEMVPMGVGLSDLKIIDCITTSDHLSEKITRIFPNVGTKIVHPSIPDYFFDEATEPKKLIINVVAKNSNDINAILKPFYWKYPNYNWVAFREVKNLPREEFAKVLREGIATIWVDTLTDFGYSALEAMATKNIVIGKVPENSPEWMESGKESLLRDNGIWFYNPDNAQDLIAGVIQSFLTNSIPEKIYKDMADTANLYRKDAQTTEIANVYESLCKKRIDELKFALKVVENNKEKVEND